MAKQILTATVIRSTKLTTEKLVTVEKVTGHFFIDGECFIDTEEVVEVEETVTTGMAWVTYDIQSRKVESVHRAKSFLALPKDVRDSIKKSIDKATSMLGSVQEKDLLNYWARKDARKQAKELEAQKMETRKAIDEEERKKAVERAFTNRLNQVKRSITFLNEGYERTKLETLADDITLARSKGKFGLAWNLLKKSESQVINAHREQARQAC